MNSTIEKITLAAAIQNLFRQSLLLAFALIVTSPVLVPFFTGMTPEALVFEWLPSQAKWSWVAWPISIVCFAVLVWVAIRLWQKVPLTEAALDLHKTFAETQFQRLLDRLQPDDPVYHWREELLRSVPCYAQPAAVNRQEQLLAGEFWKDHHSVANRDDLVEVGTGKVAYRNVRVRRWTYLMVKWSLSRRRLRRFLAQSGE